MYYQRFFQIFTESGLPINVFYESGAIKFFSNRNQHANTLPEKLTVSILHLRIKLHTKLQTSISFVQICTTLLV